VAKGIRPMSLSPHKSIEARQLCGLQKVTCYVRIGTEALKDVNVAIGPGRWLRYNIASASERHVKSRGSGLDVSAMNHIHVMTE